MILIGLNGRMKSGKDTAFEIVRDSFDFVQVSRTGFADKMKLSGVRALGYRPHSAEEAVIIANHIKDVGRIIVAVGSTPSISFSGREYWQWVGTEAHREVFGADFWVDALLPRVENPHSDQQALTKLFPHIDVLFITDTRFENEARRILDFGGEVWHIDADDRLGPLPEDAHPSEHSLPRELISRIIDNNGTLHEFKTNVNLAAEYAIKPWFYGA